MPCDRISWFEHCYLALAACLFLSACLFGCGPSGQEILTQLTADGITCQAEITIPKDRKYATLTLVRVRFGMLAKMSWGVEVIYEDGEKVIVDVKLSNCKQIGG